MNKDNPLIVWLPDKYDKYCSGFYSGFSSGGVAYNADKMTKDRIKFPTVPHVSNAPILIHKLNMKEKTDRKMVCALIDKPHQKALESNILFLGTQNGEYDNTVYGWCQICREQKMVTVLVYSLNEVIKSLQDDMNWYNALEYWEFNMLDAWIGIYTPIYFYTKEDSIYDKFIHDAVIRVD